MKPPRPAFLLVSAVLGLLVAILGATQVLGAARPVDMVLVFAGAFWAGSALTSYVHGRRSAPSHR